jgi:hypothetical protein
VRHDVLDAVASAAAAQPVAVEEKENPSPPPASKPRRDSTRKKPRHVAIELED